MPRLQSEASHYLRLRIIFAFALSSLSFSLRFRVVFAVVKITGTPCMRKHFQPHPTTTISGDNSFIFRRGTAREGLPKDRTPALGAGGPKFKSRRPDQNNSSAFI